MDEFIKSIDSVYQNNDDIDTLTHTEINSQDILDVIDMNKLNQTEKKKRGRPKKTNQLMNTAPKIKIMTGSDENLEDEEIILHLPISKSELLKINTDNYSLEDIFKNSKNNLEEFKQQINSDMNLMTSDNMSNSTNDSLNKNEHVSKYSDNYVKQLGLIVKKLKEENDELKKYLAEITPMYFTEVKHYPINLNLFDMSQNKLIPIKTNLCCWWCTYSFDCLPTFLPEKYTDDNFYVSGCFCSFNCAGAYNLSLGDNKIWDRYSLLKLLYYLINKDKINSIIDVEINIAGPKELLERYGGPMKIEEYRNNSKILGREYHKLIPPFISNGFGFEEITNSKTTKNLNILNLHNNATKNNESINLKKNKLIVPSAKHIENYITE